MSKNKKDKTTETETEQKFEENLLNRDLYLNLDPKWGNMPTAVKSIKVGFRTGVVRVTRGVMRGKDYAYTSINIGKKKDIHISDMDQLILLRELANNPEVEKLVRECAEFNELLGHE